MQSKRTNKAKQLVKELIEKKMIKSMKVRLNPNNKQLTKLFQYAGHARFAYNWTIAKQQENYKQGNKFLPDNELRKEFTQLKKLQKIQMVE